MMTQVCNKGEGGGVTLCFLFLLDNPANFSTPVILIILLDVFMLPGRQLRADNSSHDLSPMYQKDWLTSCVPEGLVN